MKLMLLVIPVSESMSDSKESNIRSKSANQSYRDNYDSIFGAKPKSSLN